MELQSVGSLISNVGFPVGVCLILLWYLFKTIRDNKQDINTLTKEFEKRVEDLSNNHKQEMTAVTKALQNNTLVMNQILEELRGGNRFNGNRNETKDS